MVPCRHTALLRPLAFWLGFAWTIAASQGQQISVLGNNVAINPGDTTPSLSDHTDFGAMDVLVGFVDRTFTIRNTTNGVLLLGLPQRVGGASGDFTLLPPGPLLGLGPSESTTFIIRFNPSFIGPRSTTVRIVNNSSAAPVFDFAIRGTGTVPEPEITVLGNDLEITDGDPLPRPADNTDFGALDIDDPAIVHSFTIRNDGDASLAISRVEMVGGNPSAFSFVTAPPNTVPIGFETTFSIAFDPATTGRHSTTVRIHNSDTNEGTYDFLIHGTGTTITPEVRLLGKGIPIASGDDTPSTADGTKFASIGIYEGDQRQSFTIENSGTGDLIIDSIETMGGEAADFVVSGVPAAPIPPGHTAPFEVAFNPSAYGPRTTTLRITSNAPAEPAHDIALFGAGGKFELLRVEQDGDNAILHFTTNPDTTASTYIYNVLGSTNLQEWSSVGSFASPGGTTEEYRVADGWVGPRRYWRIMEVTIP